MEEKEETEGSVTLLRHVISLTVNVAVEVHVVEGVPDLRQRWAGSLLPW